jgi:drug/metabolite transporter (DMT)-like permease
VVTIITGAIFLKENMTLLQLAGAILIMGSLTFLSLKNRPEKQKNEKADASCGE